MIPSGVAAVIAFFFFVVPGLSWELLLERRVPAKNESSFKEASRVAVVSTPFSVVAFAATVSAAWGIDHHWVDLLTAWIQTGHPSTAEALIVAAVGALAELVIALGLVMLVWWLAADSLYGTARVLRQSAWTYALTDPPDGAVTVATVSLLSGRSYRGRVLSFTNDLELADREIVLGQPLLEVRPDGTRIPTFEQQIVVPASSIEFIRTIQIEQSDATAALAARSGKGPP